MENRGACFNHDLSVQGGRFGDCKNRLRDLFNQFLLKYLERKCVYTSIKPLPTVCSNGKYLDLFKLFWAVKKLGGYEVTLRKDLWEFVAGDCGFGREAVVSVKLIYAKYLSELDRWLGQGNGGNNRVKNLEEMLQDLMKEFGDMNGIQKRRISDVKVVLSEIGNCGDGSDSRKRCSSNEMLDSLEDDEQIYIDSHNNLLVSTKQVTDKLISGVHGPSEGRSNDDGIALVSISSKKNDVFESTKKAELTSINSNAIVNVKVTEEDCSPSSNGSRKRKREHSPWAPMLSWLKRAATLPKDISRIPDTSVWVDHGNDELWVQALLARKELLIKRQLIMSDESSFQQKLLTMHPSMYDEDVGNNLSVEKSRVSLRLQPLHSASHQNTEESPLPSVDIGFLAKPPKKGSRVAPHYQAEIPEWTGKATESDSKWLGTRIWPLEDNKAIPSKCDSIGKGRPKTCTCINPGHVECTRFHILEKRQKLSTELRAAFRLWRIHQMGEDVSFSWTEEEEKRFKEMMKNSNNGRNGNLFWRRGLKILPNKTREELVSYYFNVFVIRRRMYQNRVTPMDVDSDDDEKEVGSVGDGKPAHVPVLDLSVCTENKEYLEFE